MTEPAEKNPLDDRCLEVLKAIGKTLSQMNLYSASHPAVQGMMAETVDLLAGILTETGGELAYSIDQDKLVADGRLIGQVGQVPNSIAQCFQRFKLQSVTFRSGVSAAELSVFCQMAALRPEAAKGIAPHEHLSSQNVVNITLDEIVYTKAGEEEPQPVPAAAPAGEDPSSSAETASRIVEMVEAEPLEKSLAELVRHAVRDPKDQVAVMKSVLNKVQSELELKVRTATTELREARNVLQNEAGRTQAVMGQMADGVITVDNSGQVLMMNPEAEELFESRLNEMAGKSLSDMVKEEHMLALAKDMAKPRKDEVVEQEAGTVSKGDSAKTLRASTVVVQNEEGKPVGMVSSLSDKAKHHELQKKERAFVAHVTHELRAPLSSIRAALDILHETVTEKLQEDEKKVMNAAVSNTDRLENLINGILDFSKIESGQMDVLCKPVNSERIAHEAVESLRPWATKKRVNLDLSAQPEVPMVYADLSRTIQVLVNLISNAVKFTPKGGHITVHVGAGTGQYKGFVIYAVQDTGPGIPKDQQAKVFEKFVQISAGERHVGGTGLGLSIAKALVHLQKGQMWLESAPGKGARFSFTLPEYVRPAEEQVERPKPKPGAVPWWKRLLGLE